MRLGEASGAALAWPLIDSSARLLSDMASFESAGVSDRVVTSPCSEIRLLLTAVQYFTRVPMPRWVGHDGAQLSGTTRYLPGSRQSSLGAVAAAACSGCVDGVSSRCIAAILSTIATAVLTGALHEDGLADTMDGLGGGHTRERALEIMKDPRIGALRRAGVDRCVLSAEDRCAQLLCRWRRSSPR